MKLCVSHSHWTLTTSTAGPPAPYPLGMISNCFFLFVPLPGWVSHSHASITMKDILASRELEGGGYLSPFLLYWELWPCLSPWPTPRGVPRHKGSPLILSSQEGKKTNGSLSIHISHRFWRIRSPRIPGLSLTHSCVYSILHHTSLPLYLLRDTAQLPNSDPCVITTLHFHLQDVFPLSPAMCNCGSHLILEDAGVD